MASPGDVFFDFENMPVRITATRKIPAIETPGITIDETEEGGVLTVPVWVAFELVEAGLVTENSLESQALEAAQGSSASSSLGASASIGGA